MESPIETKPVALSPAELRYALLILLGERLAGVFVVAWLGVLYFLAMQGELSLNGLLGTLGRWWPAPLTLGGTQVAILWLAPWTAMRSPHYQSLLRPTRYRLDAETLTIMPADADPLVRPYRSLRGTSRVRHLLALRQADGRYLLIPKRACRNPGELEAFQALLPPAPAPIEPQAAPGRGPWSDLATNLWTGLGLTLLRPGSEGRLRSGAGQVPLLALVALLVGMAGDWLAVSGRAEIDFYAFEQQATQVVALMLGALWIAWLLGSTARWLPVLVLLLSLEPFFALGSQLLDQASGALTPPRSAGQALDLLLFLWILGVWLRALHALAPGRPRARAWGVLVLFALTILPFWWLPQQSFWYAAAPPQREPRVNIEDTYYAQPELLQRALDDLAPERPGRVDLYFLGFAGYADEQVFRREIEHARRIVDARLDTRGRSLVLINSPVTVERVPIASTSNLRLALHGIASKMNPREDVLFLYLTSHGSDRLLAVDFDPLGLNLLTPGELRQMLDEAGIRWRIVAVSACYSGSFLGALRDPGTLVMTAASADRASFGCSNENEYTYFGEALFAYAFPKTRSFTEAFALASRHISDREHAEHQLPSQPQIRVGDAIGAQLTRLQRRLDGPAVEQPAGCAEGPLRKGPPTPTCARPGDRD